MLKITIMWVLVIMSGNGNAIDHIDGLTERTCAAAAEKINKARPSVLSICIQKNGEPS